MRPPNAAGGRHPGRARPLLAAFQLGLAMIIVLAGIGGLATRTARGIDATTPLQTVGALATTLGAATGNDLRSRLGTLLAAPDSAWRDLTRDDRALLLDGAVTWVPYLAADAIDATAAAPIAFDPVAVAALELFPDLELNRLAINEVLLTLPSPALTAALLNAMPTAVALDHDAILVVDHVIVAMVEDGGLPPPDLLVGTVDDRGLLLTAAAPGPRATNVATEPARPSPTPPATTRLAASGREIPPLPLDALPPEALDTIILIAADGPFPFRQDGTTFGNFEGNLPAAPDGFYREYTVVTPGADDRGARRIVTGGDGQIIYYTDDHYDSFSEVILDE